jgi:hypothetical protein
LLLLIKASRLLATQAASELALFTINEKMGVHFPFVKMIPRICRGGSIFLTIDVGVFRIDPPLTLTPLPPPPIFKNKNGGRCHAESAKLFFFNLLPQIPGFGIWGRVG